MPGERAHRLPRAQRIGAAPVERAAAFGRQRFGKDEIAIEHVGGGKDRGGHERRARADLAEKAADRRTGDKADAERRADEAEVARALLGLGDVGDRGLRRSIAAAENARQRARDKQPGQSLDDRQQRIIDREPAEREQQHAPPAEMIGQIAEHGRCKKGRDRHDEPDPRADLDRMRQIDAADLHHELRQHRHDDAETDRIHEDRRDDERDGARCVTCSFFLSSLAPPNPPSCVADR
jgi:hypothetical protein